LFFGRFFVKTFKLHEELPAFFIFFSIGLSGVSSKFTVKDEAFDEKLNFFLQAY